MMDTPIAVAGEADGAVVGEADGAIKIIAILGVRGGEPEIEVEDGDPTAALEEEEAAVAAAALLTQVDPEPLLVSVAPPGGRGEKVG